jgi:hypothetical protein
MMKKISAFSSFRRLQRFREEATEAGRLQRLFYNRGTEVKRRIEALR